MDRFRLDGKVALVTGGASGIGAAVSLALAEQGASVAIHYFSSGSKADAIASAAKIRGARTVGIQADLSKPGEADRVVETAVKELGGLDILVNNAGFLVKRCPVAEMPDELYRTIVDVNLTSTFWMCRAALVRMLRKGEGSIVNMASAAAFAGGVIGDVAKYDKSRQLAETARPARRVPEEGGGACRSPDGERSATPQCGWRRIRPSACRGGTSLAFTT
jgi:3-oxoacyl-[acyl-carrier protein] reductase